MAAEVVVIAGPLLGSRFPLASEEVRIGRAANSTICIPAHDVAWHQCLIHAADGQYELVDSQSGSGTYVNGLLARRHTLERGDHIGIGESTLLFTTEELITGGGSPGETLLRACTVLHLMRALA